MPRHEDHSGDHREEQGRSWVGHPNPRRQGRMSEETRNEPQRDVKPGDDYERYGMENEDWRHMDSYWRTMYGDSYPHEKEWNRGGRVGTYSGRVPDTYKRIDDRIQEDIHERLMQYPMIDATGVGVFRPLRLALPGDGCRDSGRDRPPGLHAALAAPALARHSRRPGRPDWYWSVDRPVSAQRRSNAR